MKKREASRRFRGWKTSKRFALVSANGKRFLGHRITPKLCRSIACDPYLVQPVIILRLKMKSIYTSE
jgi:hypothetical protein